jgi:hypothetical protein
MTVSYYKIAGLGIFMTGLAVTGAALLGLGLAGPQVEPWAGHTWQLITGGTLLGVGILAAPALFAKAHFSQFVTDKDALKALKNDSEGQLWTYARNESGRKVLISKSETGVVTSNSIDLPTIRSIYTRVCV